MSDENYADSRGSDVIQRVCNGTVNPVTQPAGVCEKQGTQFTHSTSGILHFSSDSSEQAVASALLNRSALGVERLSAYRFLDEELLAFEDGGALLWCVQVDGRGRNIEGECLHFHDLARRGGRRHGGRG